MGPARRHSRRWASAWALLAGFWAILPSARADGLGDLESLLSEQIVTSASKQAEGASSAPALSTSLSADDLRRYGVKTLAEAIDFLTVGVKTSGNLNGREIGARGVLLTGDRGSHFLLLVDGHAVNEPLRGSAWLGVGAGVPMEIIDHIEVIVGAGSVLYGSNAMLGLINVVTKRAKDNAGLHLVAESSVWTSARMGAGYTHKFSLFGSEAEITAHGEYYRQFGPYMTFGPVNTGVEPDTGSPGRNSRDALGTGIWGGTQSENSPFAEVPAGMLRVSVGDVELNYREVHYTHSAPTGVGNYDDPGTKQWEVRRSADLKYRHTMSALLDVSARLYGDYFSYRNDLLASRFSLCPVSSDAGAPTCDLLDKGTAMWAGTELQTSWDWLKDARLVTMAGVDARWRSMNTKHDRLNVTTGLSTLPRTQQIPGIDRSDITVGAYLQQTWTPMPNLRFNGGLRVDRDSRFDPVLVKRLSANWEAWKNGQLKLAYAEAFRAPSWDESDDSAADRIAANAASRPNVDTRGVNLGTPLKPETVKSIEGSIQQKLGAHRFLVGGFYSRWNNLVHLRQLSAAETNTARSNGLTAPLANGVLLTQYQNVSTIDNYGLNVGIDGAVGFDALQYGLSATLAEARVKTPDAPGATTVTAGAQRNGNIAPAVFGNARIAYIPGGMWPTIALAAQFMGKQSPDQYLVLEDGTSLEPRVPAQVEGRLTLSGAVPAVKHLSYRVIANYALADQGPYVVGPVMVARSSALYTFDQTPPRLIPVDRFRVTCGLQVDF